MKRYAIVRGATPGQVEAYLPGNYRVIYAYEVEQGVYLGGGNPHTLDRPPKVEYVIAGTDHAGWTLDDYVIPRYASGLIGCEEIDLSHPIMKQVPA